jgi:subtilisin-like proprotein convertase family protein
MHRTLSRLAVTALVLATSWLAAPVHAALPTTLGVDGSFKASTGGAAPDGQYPFTVAIYKDASGGNALWTEGPVQIQVSGGIFAYSLGSTTPLTPDVLATGRYLGITVGSDPELPRVAFASVAFAVRASIAEGIDCSGCLAGSALKPSSITTDKVGFAYASADSKGGSALKALDLQCTGCVSVAEISWDGDVDLKDKKLTTGGITSAGGIAAKEFVGDGSKLTGISQPQGKCPAGKAVTGISPDGQLTCGVGVDPTGLPADGLNEVSNNLLSNQFTDVIGSKAAVPIPDNNPLGATDTIVMPDIGVAQKLTISVNVSNSDVSNLQFSVTDPNGATFLLYTGGSTGAQINTTYPDPTAPVSGDLGFWIGKNPKGNWKIKVVDSGYLNNATDGQLNKWSINLSTLSNQKIQASGNLIVSGSFLPAGGCPGSLVNGVCLASAGINGTFLASSKTCGAMKADICTDSQMWTLRRSSMLNSNANWTNSFADNDGGQWSETNGGTGDDHSTNSNWLAPCCYNLTPVRPTDTKAGGVRVVYVNNAENTYYRNAAQFCNGMQADLCDKAQYWVIRKAGVVSVRVWSSDHSDNDNTSSTYEKGIGGIPDDPSIDQQYGFACCATDRADLTCPGTEVNGVCMVKINNTGGDWNTAASDCAGSGARVCSDSQSAVLRDAGVLSAKSNWTASYADNDGGNAAAGVGAAGDDHANSSVYGYACCL